MSGATRWAVPASLVPVGRTRLVRCNPRHSVCMCPPTMRWSIAYWELGWGPPLIHNLSFHLEAQWDVPSMASLYRALADRRCRLIRLNALIRLNDAGKRASENPFPRFGTTPSGAQAGMTTGDMGLNVSAVASALGADRFTPTADRRLPISLEVARIPGRWLHGAARVES